MAGAVVPGWTPPKQKGKETYAAAIDQQAGDYDEIMDRYRRMSDSGLDPNMAALANQYKQIGMGQQAQHFQDPNVDRGIRNLGGLARTGGYSQQGIADLRARGISPIRATYQNAMTDITRQRALQGGYSPNYTASMTKLARDLSESISSGVQKVNAGIAENVASNRLQAAPQYAGAAQSNTNARNDFAIANKNQKMGALGALGNIYGQQNQLKQTGVQGMQSLYGTTPALVNTFGNQGVQQGQLDLQRKSEKRQGSNVLIDAYMRGRR